MDDTALAQSRGCPHPRRYVNVSSPLHASDLFMVMLSFIFKSFQHGQYDRDRLF